MICKMINHSFVDQWSIKGMIWNILSVCCDQMQWVTIVSTFDFQLYVVVDDNLIQVCMTDLSVHFNVYLIKSYDLTRTIEYKNFIWSKIFSMCKLFWFHCNHESFCCQKSLFSNDSKFNLIFDKNQSSTCESTTFELYTICWKWNERLWTLHEIVNFNKFVYKQIIWVHEDQIR